MQLRRHSRGRRTTTRGLRTATSRPSSNALQVANPREAALQGLAKMRALAARGFAQACCRRTSGRTCRCAARARLRRQRSRRHRRGGARCAAICSPRARRRRRCGSRTRRRSAPSADTADGRVHFTPANLVDALPSLARGADDDARSARDLRRRDALSPSTIRCRRRRSSATKAPPTTRASQPASRSPASSSSSTAAAGSAAARAPARYPARQTREAGEAVARRHGLDPARTVFAQQSPDSDRRRRLPQRRHRRRRRHVAAVPRARVRRPAGGARRAAHGRRRRVHGRRDRPTTSCRVADAVAHVPLQQPALAAPDGAPAARRAGGMPRASAASRLLDRLVDGALADRRSADVRSAAEHAQRRRAGVPAAARAADGRRARARLRANVFLDAALDAALDGWIRRHYRDRLAPADLRDPALLDESRRALDELTRTA